MAMAKEEEAVEPFIDIFQQPVLLFRDVFPQHHGRENGHQGKREDQGAKQGKAQGEGQRREHLALDFLERENRQEGRDDDEF